MDNSGQQLVHVRSHRVLKIALGLGAAVLGAAVIVSRLRGR